MVIQVLKLRSGLRLNVLRRMARSLNTYGALRIGVMPGRTLGIGLESHVLQIDMNVQHTLPIDLSHIYSRSMWVPIIHCVRLDSYIQQIDVSTNHTLRKAWLIYTADRCEYRSYTAYRLDSYIQQIDVSTDHTLRTGLTHIYCRSMWILLLYRLWIWVTNAVDRCEYRSYTAYRFESHKKQVDVSTIHVLRIGLRKVCCGMVWGLNVCCRSSRGQNIEVTFRCEADKRETWTCTVDRFESSTYSTVPCQTRVYILRVGQRVWRATCGSSNSIVKLTSVVCEK